MQYGMVRYGAIRYETKRNDLTIYVTSVNKVNGAIHVKTISMMYTRLVSNSAPTWSSRCCFTACHF